MQKFINAFVLALIIFFSAPGHVVAGESKFIYGSDEKEVEIVPTKVVHTVKAGAYPLNGKELGEAIKMAAKLCPKKRVTIIPLMEKDREGDKKLAADRIQAVVTSFGKTGLTNTSSVVVKPEVSEDGQVGVRIECAQKVKTKPIAEAELKDGLWFIRDMRAVVVADVAAKITDRAKTGCSEIQSFTCRASITGGESDDQITAREKICEAGIKMNWPSPPSITFDRNKVVKGEAGIGIGATCKTEKPAVAAATKTVTATVAEKKAAPKAGKVRSTGDAEPAGVPVADVIGKREVRWTAFGASALPSFGLTLELHEFSNLNMDGNSRSTVLATPIGFGLGLWLKYDLDFIIQATWDRAKLNVPGGIAPTYWGIEAIALGRPVNWILFGGYIRGSFGYDSDRSRFLSSQGAIGPRLELLLDENRTADFRLFVSGGIGFESNAGYVYRGAHVPNWQGFVVEGAAGVAITLKP